MGASFFITSSKGETPQEAFESAVRRAQYESGHGGYTGTIAVKDSFVMIDLPDGVEPFNHADELVDDPRISSKWGPAGCFKLPGDQYYFFGWASS